MSGATIERVWSLSGAAVLEPWRRRARGEFPVEPRFVGGPTPSELVLWAALAARNEGWCREYATGRYRLDFFLPAYGLAVEVDGSSHDGPVRRAADDRRDAWHQDQLGIVTARYTADEVLQDCGGVVADIQRRVSALTSARRLEPPRELQDDIPDPPLAFAEAECESLAVAVEKAEAEITRYVAQATLTVLPIIEQRGPVARLLSMFGR